MGDIGVGAGLDPSHKRSKKNKKSKIIQIVFAHVSGERFPLTALTMPLFHFSLADFNSYYREDSVPLEILVPIAKGLLSALSLFGQYKLSHCDVKPENVMLKGLTPILLDLSGVVEFGNPIDIYTPYYALDASAVQVTPLYDLNCLITSIARCIIKPFDLKKERTRLQMKTEIEEFCRNDKELYRNFMYKLFEKENSSDAFKLF